jgi:6-phosphogluconolactonase
MQNIRWHHIDSAEEMTARLANAICELANACIREHGHFAIVLAGGNTPRPIYQCLRHCKTDWSHWHIYFGDERCLPVGHPERNDSMAHADFLDQVPIPHENIQPIPSQLPASRCISEYTDVLKHAGEFDLVLLGLGEDGHTASLFADHDWGATGAGPAVLAITDAPKPPPHRISLSAQRLSNTKHVWFIVTGENKRDVLIRWQNGEKIPASAIQPTGNPVEVFYNVSVSQ